MTLASIAPLLLLASPAPTRDRPLAVVAVSEPPGPSPELIEITRQLRAACRDQDVVSPGDLRARVAERGSAERRARLERAYSAAMERYDAGEHGGAARALRAVVDELERLPDSPATHAQWLRAQLRLAQAELTLGRPDAYRGTLERVASADPRHEPDGDEFSPTFRHDLEAARARVASRPRRRLTVTAIGGWAATVYVDGRAMGPAPLALDLPSGRHRVGGVAGKLRVPSTWIDLDEPRSVALDFALAEALRPDAGPGLAVLARSRAASTVALGRWIGASRVLAVSVAGSGGGPVVVGRLYDVARDALVREAHVRAGSPLAVAALARFLVAGQRSVDVVVGAPDAAALVAAPPTVADPPTESVGGVVALAPAPDRVSGDGAPAAEKAPAPVWTPTAFGASGTGVAVTAADLRPVVREPFQTVDAPRASRAWMRPAAYGTALAALAAGGLALQQGLTASSASREASGLVRTDGTLNDPGRYRDLVAAGGTARRNAWIGGIGAAALAATAGALGYLSFTDSGAPAVRF